MIFFVALLPALLGLAGLDELPPPQARTRIVQNEFVTRIPVRPRPDRPRFIWEEAKGPKCIASNFIVGALLSDSDHVDFVMSSNRRFRARFDADCHGLDFYAGFYVNSPSRLICAGRDEIRSRMGEAAQSPLSANCCRFAGRRFLDIRSGGALAH